MNNLFSALFFAAFLTTAICGQNPAPTPAKTDVDVVRISTSLIQIDATVTDKDGNTVTDLTADDFEVYENGEKQPITNFSFIALQPEKAAKAPPLPTDSSINLPSVPIRLRPEQVRRTIALVVDDLGLSFANTKFVKDSLKKFVNEQMQPGDLVAIVSTGKGMGALQQFTTDKRMLYAAIEKIKFNAQRETWSFAPIQPSFKDEVNAMMNAATGETTGNVGEGGTSGDVLGTAEDRLFDISLNQFREDVFSRGTLGAIKFVINGMKQINGRKAVMLFSEGFSLMQSASMNPNEMRTQINPRLEGAIRELTDTANRSGVIIYAVDPRGLVNPGFTAEDRQVGLRDNPFAQDGDERAREQKLIDTQNSLKYITEETGGFAVLNNNNINKGIQRVLNDQRGYYLLAYQPDEDTFDPAKRRFNKLTIKLRRPDLKIRYRSGFFSVSDSDSAAKTPQQRMLDALTSPFGAGEISLDLTTLFANDAKDGSFMRSFMHIKGGDLIFVEEKDGWHTAKFEVLAVTFGENGEIADKSNRAGLIRVKADALKEIQERGLIYSMTTPAKTPGAYQFRVALRDLTNSKIGAANQFIEVPNLKKQLALSGLLLESSETREKRRRGENNILQSDTQRDRAVRTFRAGSQIMFGASIYNYRAKSGAPNLSTQFRIFRANQPIFTSEESPLAFDGRSDTQSVDIGGAFGLGGGMPPGEYILQVIVKDSSSNGKPKIAAQWIDFEVIK